MCCLFGGKDERAERRGDTGVSLSRRFRVQEREGRIEHLPAQPVGVDWLSTPGFQGVGRQLRSEPDHGLDNALGKAESNRLKTRTAQNHCFLTKETGVTARFKSLTAG